MSGGELFLGPVRFDDFELPEVIRCGGTQRAFVHRLPGGGRVIDIFGRDDAEISWCGVFSGSDAADRARALDLMRVSGAVWPLTWDSFFYSVLLSCFEIEYARSNWIPYRIDCTVLRDEAAAPVEIAASLGAGLLADMGAAVAVGPGVDLSLAQGALALPNATTRDSADYLAATSAVQGASTLIATRLDAADATLPGIPLTTPTALAAATDAAGQLAALSTARGFVLRAQANLQTAST